MKEIVKYTGIGGLAIILVVDILKIIIKKINFTKLDNLQTFKVIKMIMYVCSIIVIFSVITYGLITFHEKGILQSKKEINNTNTVNGNNNNIINGDNNSINKHDSTK